MMANLTTDYVLDKYWEIIKEEINVKDVSVLSWAGEIKKIFKPIGSQISAKFGKDTWNVIKFGKMWNIKEWENWTMIVFDDAWNEWTLAKEDYEISYEWLDGKDVAADGDVMLSVKIVYDKEIMNDTFNLENEEEIQEHLWEKVKEINKTMPAYKYIREIIVTDEELIKTTTRKIKRHEELKKILG